MFPPKKDISVLKKTIKCSSAIDCYFLFARYCIKKNLCLNEKNMGTLKSFWGWKDEKNDNGSGAEDSCFLLLIPSFSFQILILPMFWLFERKSNKTFQGCKTEPIGIVFFVIGVSLLSICKKKCQK